MADNGFASLSGSGSGSGSGVTSLNTLTGAVTLAAGSGISITPSSNTLTIAATGGSGTVTSVALSAPSSVLTVSGSPVTSTGTLTLALATQSANLVFAGPTSGGAAAPTFRALVAGDLPGGGATVGYADNFALTLNSTVGGQYLDLGNNLAPVLGTPYSVSIWAYFNVVPPPTANTFFGKVTGGPSFAGFDFYVTSTGALSVDLTNTRTTNQIQTTSVANTVNTAGQWHHYAMTWTGGTAASTVKCYQDGVAVTMTPVIDNLTGSIAATGNMTVGYESDDPSGFNGLIDDVAFFVGTALTPTQVAAIAETGQPGNLTTVAGLTGLTNYYQLEPSSLSGSTFSDSVGSVSATAIGNPLLSQNVPNQFFLSAMPQTYTPPGGTANQPGVYSMGVQFVSSVSGFIPALRFYKSASCTENARQGRLYTIGGSLLATFQFTNETSSGFQVSDPVYVGNTAVVAGTSYVAAVDLPSFFDQDLNLFATPSNVTNGTLSLQNSRYVVGTGLFPSNTAAGNIGDGLVDVVFTQSLGTNTNVGAGWVSTGNVVLTNGIRQASDSAIALIQSYQTVLSGSAGTASFTQTVLGTSNKVTCYLAGFTDTGTQVYTFPKAFSQTPFVYGLTAGVAGATATTTTLTFTVTTLTGFVFLEGE